MTSHGGRTYGVKAIWSFKSKERVLNKTYIPWKDGSYKWILHCKPVVEFKTPFSEQFRTYQKKSEFGPGKIKVKTVTMSEVKTPYFVEHGSSIQVF